jgi:hypothetical protein
MTTVIAEKDGVHHKLFKVWFGKDGTFYITVPYHSAQTATLTKRTICYDTPFGEHFQSPPAFLDVATLEQEDDLRVKLSYHPSGFCHFSGPSIVSGIDDDGRVRGIGVFARALEAIGPGFGPVAINLLYGIEGFTIVDQIPNESLVFRNGDLLLDDSISRKDRTDEDPQPEMQISEAMTIEAFYFTPQFRRFVHRSQNGDLEILNSHPTGIVIPLKVVPSPTDCELPGFLGLYACRQHVRFPSTTGFVLNGPAENHREDAYGRRLGDVISCHAPQITMFEGRDLSFRTQRP